MKNLNKILIIPILASCLILNTVSADNSDCWKFWAMSYSDWWWSYDIVNTSRETSINRYTNFLSVGQQAAIIRKDDLNTALINLKKFCCENDLWDLTADTCNKDAPYFNPNALDSPYLFDHLFDVIVRRLNWLTTDVDIYTKTNMSTDDKWTERREWIDEQAKSTAWTTPQNIINKYKSVWAQSPFSYWFNITNRVYSTFWDLNDQDFLNYVAWKWWSNISRESQVVANAMKNYSQRTLYDRYINACALSEYFYALLDLWVDSEDKDNTIKRLSDRSCDRIIERQIDWENAYVVLVIHKSANLFLSNLVEWYMSYLYQRQEKFEKLWTDIVNKRMDDVRWVPNLENRTVK